MKALKEQILATQPNKNIWVSANAGTGKTFILVNRFIRLILDGNEPHRIVCITYTKAAAAEMQKRIISNISQLVLLSDNDLKAKLEEQYNESFDIKKLAKNKVKLANLLDFPEQLKIQTIHSFCQSVLKSFPLEAGIPPFFNVIDDIAAQELATKTWNEIILADNEALNFLLSRFQLRSIKNLFSELAAQRERLFALTKDKGGVDSYLNYLKDALGIETENFSAIEAKFKNDTADFLPQLAQVLAKGKKIEAAILEDLNVYFKTKSIDDLEIVLFSEKGDLRQYYLKTLTKDHPILAATAMDIADELKAIMVKKRDVELYNITKNSLKLFMEFSQRFEMAKRQRYMLDYDDLISKTAELLDKNNINSQWVLYKLDGGVDHILLDEAQDTNPNQWKVIDAITSEFFSGEGAKERKRSLFVVGDEKQSIYSFQGADVRVFNQKKSYFEKIRAQNIELNFEAVTLNRSFRSAKAVLDVVDSVLKNQKVKAAVTELDNIANHEVDRKGFGYFEINELCGNELKSNHDNDQTNWRLPREYIAEEELKNKEIAANQVVERIDALLNRNIILASTGTPPTAGDIMVLLRKRDELSELLIKKLQQKNIPVSGIDRLRLNENLAVKDLISLGKFLLLENDDLNFACLLKSPVFSVSEEDLFSICWNRGEKSVYRSLLDSNFKELIKKLERTKEELTNKPVFEFFYTALEIIGLRKEFISYFGTQINEILDEFLSVVKNYEQQQGISLQGFIGWFEKSEIEIKRNLNNKQNEVRILTVHGAKGLEAPIVIIPDTTSIKNNYSNFGFTNDIFLCPFIGEYKNDLFKKIEEVEKAKEEAEYYRLLYVALTRAADELYIFGYKTRKTSSTETWHNIVWASALELCEKHDGKLVYTNSGYLNNTADTKKNNLKKVIDVKFGPLSKQEVIEVISPSSLYIGSGKKLSAENFDFSRGLAIHKLLELLPNIDRTKWDDVAEIVFKTYPTLTDDDKQAIIKETTLTLENKEFSFIFSGRSKAEVPVCGMSEGKFISGSMDRLIETDNEIIVIDFKTNSITESELEETAEKYRPQLNAYKVLLEKIYKGKKVKTALLFTSINRLHYF